MSNKKKIARSQLWVVLSVVFYGVGLFVFYQSWWVRVPVGLLVLFGAWLVWVLALFVWKNEPED